jgi:photosystem II stability/assembly factor-like uncharacterized protein
MKATLIFTFLLATIFCLAQNKTHISQESVTPEWAIKMHNENPNVNEVDALYAEFYKNNAFVKNTNTQFYKRWRKAINPYLGDDGFYDVAKKEKLSILLKSRVNASTSVAKSGNWSPIGPLQNFRSSGIESGAQANVMSIARCATFPNVMYCGTEPGEIYKSVDGADNWVNVSNSLVTSYAPGAVIANAGVQAVAVHPTDPNIVYAGSASEVFKTINGGLTWDVVFNSNLSLWGYMENPAEILIHEANPQIVILAGKAGIHRSTDGGATWAQVLTNACYDVKSKPGDPNVLYTVRNNTSLIIPEFYRSIDGGANWSLLNSGWYSSSDPNRSVEGARLAVSAADNLKIYAFLIGNSKTGDNGFIGIYKSNDGGLTWNNTMGFDGSPYTFPGHPNLISSDPVTSGFSFNQGFYNCAIMASNTNADEILVGGIGMWRSNDGGQTFTCIHNYVCGLSYAPMHVDMQDFRAFGGDYWATTDGGIFKSTDLFASQPEFKMKGLQGTDFWGFGSGWNYDILVGGTFHNGVDVYCEGYPFGDFLDLGGGEPASGYVNPGDSLRIYSSNVGSKIIPTTITGAVTNVGMGMSPTESPWFAESSTMEFSPFCYNHVYLGSGNQLFKSIDGGANYAAIYTDPDASSLVLGIETTRANPSKMFIVVRPFSGNAKLLTTTDDWVTSTNISLPSGGANLVLVSVDPENEQVIWVAYPRGPDGGKVFKSINGGASWTNQTSSQLDAQNIQSIETIGGTDGGVYIGTSVSCYYKNNSLSNWVIDNLNLPITIGTTGLRPFYRDGKIRLASYGKGIWESNLYEVPTRPVAQIMVDKLSASCTNDVFYFDDYSMLNHAGATWEWTFANANITNSSQRNPAVTFTSVGSHLITLKVTNSQGNWDIDSLYIEILSISNGSISENFETTFMPLNWFQEASAGFSWVHMDSIGGYSLSSKCMMVDNYVTSLQGDYCDIIAPINMSAISPSAAWLYFDVAYTTYSANYTDSLEVLISNDCGLNWNSLYLKPGDVLATAPLNQTARFIPSSSDWRTDSIDLSTYIGSSNVYVKFRNYNGFGQPLYIDNINLGGIVTADIPEEKFGHNDLSIYPNPLQIGAELSINTEDQGIVQFSLFNIEGKFVANYITKNKETILLNNPRIKAGIYLYSIKTSEKIKKGKLIILE